MAKGITSRQDDYAQWYLDIVHKAGLASNSQVRGCMVFKPNGFELRKGDCRKYILALIVEIIFRIERM